jgi:arginyl-tRNA---protein transferase
MWILSSLRRHIVWYSEVISCVFWLVYNCVVICSTYMLAAHYDFLMNRGFRRCGTFIYKPVMHKVCILCKSIQLCNTSLCQTCCPQYTIRLKADQFQPSRSQRQVSKKINKILSTKSPETQSEFTISTEVACFSTERFLLFKKYQTSVHGDEPNDVTEKSFSRFLVETALVDGGAMCGPYKCGTYHQLYRLDGRLVAVGVLDILPSGVSSVYLFYDPADKALSLGKYSALREIEFCRELGLDYYYMGFYIHTCAKMKYKGEYAPSELLCPSSLSWFPLGDCLPRLDRFRFTPFRDDLATRREAIAVQCRGLSADQPLDSAAGESALSAEEVRELQQFAPAVGDSTDISSLLLDLKSPARFFLVADITQKGQDILKPILEDWLAIAGQSIAKQIIITLG